MKSEKVRVAVEGWNFCNRVGIESPAAPSPRWADCTDINCGNSHSMLASLFFFFLLHISRIVSQLSVRQREVYGLPRTGSNCVPNVEPIECFL